jgi:MFS family permease
MSITAGGQRRQYQSLGFMHAMLIVFAPFACGYFFSYFYRSVNAVVAPYLRDDIGVNAAELGLLSAAYFLTFAFCQLPLGIVLDRYGPRRVQGTLYCIAAVGAVLFSFGDSVIALVLARALIGIGVAGGLMAALKAIVQWFPRERIATINGLYITAGALGAIAATVPTELAIQYMGWRYMFVALAAANFLAALLILFVVPEKPNSAAPGNFATLVRELGTIYRDPFFWRITPLMCTTASAQMAIQGLWAGPWMSDVAGMPKEIVADHLLLVAIFLGIGVSLSGPFATLCRRIGLSIGGACALATFLSIIMLMLVVMRVEISSYLVWSLVGSFGTLTSLVFAAMAEHFPETHIGRANTAVNVMVFGMSFTYMFGMGAIIELWDPLPGGAYPTEAYVTAFLATIATLVAALVWYLWPLKGRY